MKKFLAISALFLAFIIMYSISFPTTKTENISSIDAHTLWPTSTDETTYTPPTETTEIIIESISPDYVLNKNTMKFHCPNCPSVDKIKSTNRVDYNGTRDTIKELGYIPCKKCNP